MSVSILGAAQCGPEAATAMARAHGAEEWFATELPALYWRICPELGVRPEVAYAQACHETGFGRYGRAVTPEHNNYCGLKTRNPGADDAADSHYRFPSPAVGVIAHRDHLHLYARGVVDPTPDPRHFPHLAGVAPTVEELSGRWAPSSTYHTKIVTLLEEITMARRGFVIHHNGPPANCLGQPHSRCERFWAVVCKYHARKFGSKWSDSVYSFGVCPHGVRFTGRGWNRSQAANGSDQVGSYDGRDSEWYTVMVFLGTDEAPTPEMVEAVRSLIAEGRSSGRCGDRVLPHNAFKRKACPGPEFTHLAAQWDGAPLTTTPSEEDMDPHTLVVLIYLGVLGRLPESLQAIQGGADYIAAHGQNAYLQAVLGSDEAKARWG